jgi:hypothetical protein
MDIAPEDGRAATLKFFSMLAQTWQLFEGENPSALTMRTLSFIELLRATPIATLKTLDKVWQVVSAGCRHVSAAPALDVLIRDAYPADPVARVKATIVGCETIQQRTEALRPLLRDLVFQGCLHVGPKTLLGDLVAASGKALKLTDLKTALAEFRSGLAARRERDGTASPYTYEDGVGFVVAAKGGPARMTNFHAEIVEEKVLRAVDGDQLVFAIDGRMADGTDLARIEVPSDEFGEMEWVTARWGARPIILPGFTQGVRAAIQTISDPRREVSYTQTGWQEIGGQRLHLMPGGAIGARGHCDVPCHLPTLERYQRPRLPTSDEEAREALSHSLAILDVGPRHVTLPVLLFTYMAPLASMLGGVSMVLWMVGQSGSYKSALAALAQSHFGTFDFDSLPLSFFSTANAIENRIFQSRDLLVTVDNLVPSRTGKDQIEATSKAQRLVQMIGDGQARARLDRDLTERAPRRPCAAVVVTAEILPPENDSTLGRTFQVHVRREAQGRPGDIDLRKLQQVRLHIDLLQKSMGGYIQWLASKDPAEVVALRESKRAAILAGCDLSRCHTRALDQLALFLVTQELLCEYCRSIGHAEAAEVVSSTRTTDVLVAGVRGQTRPTLRQGWEAWLDALQVLVAQRRVAFATSTSSSLEPPSRDPGDPAPPELIGWLGGDGVVLVHPTAAHRAVERYLGSEYRYDPTEIGRQLLAATTGDESLLAATEDGRATVVRRVGGGRVRVFAFRLQAFDGFLQQADGA